MEQRYLRKANEDDTTYGLRLIEIKKTEKPDSLDWQDIVDLVGLEMHRDSLRKSQDTVLGGYSVGKYFKALLEKEKLNKISDVSVLDEVKDIIGELDVKKQEIRYKTSQLSKIKRDFIKSIEITNDLKQYMEENNFTVNIPEYCNDKLEDINEDYIMILNISDFHIGCLINTCKDNSYDFSIAKQRIDILINECYKYIEMYGIKKIYLINTGDSIEHNSMRKTQNQYCEFGQSEQINKAIDLIYYLIVALCKYCNVEYDSIGGNHDRMNGDFKSNYDGDNADNIITTQLIKYIELSKNERANVINRKHTDKEIIKVINGLTCKFIHGDNQLSKDGKTIMKNEMSMNNEFYDILFQGHWHNFKIESENNGRYIITTGCLSGFNDFSKRFGCTTVASQTIAIIGNKKVELIKDVQLN